MSHKEDKKRYFEKKYQEASIIECACGCGVKIKEIDRYARPVKYVNGHNGRIYDDPSQFKREWNHRNKKQRFSYKTLRCKELKSKLIISKGGKCMNCTYPYNGDNAAAFDMHHRDESSKLFSVRASSFNQYSLELIYKEADKCDLLCAICHRLFHN